MKLGNISKNDDGRAALDEDGVRKLFPGLCGAAETNPMVVPAAGFKIQNLTIRKPRTFVVKIRFSR